METTVGLPEIVPVILSKERPEGNEPFEMVNLVGVKPRADITTGVIVLPRVSTVCGGEAVRVGHGVSVKRAERKGKPSLTLEQIDQGVTNDQPSEIFHAALANVDCFRICADVAAVPLDDPAALIVVEFQKTSWNRGIPEATKALALPGSLPVTVGAESEAA